MLRILQKIRKKSLNKVCVKEFTSSLSLVCEIGIKYTIPKSLLNIVTGLPVQNLRDIPAKTYPVYFQNTSYVLATHNGEAP